MSEFLRPVSEVYEPTDERHFITDEPVDDHYRTWGYSIGYEFDSNNNPVPEAGNTAIFRIAPKGLTEPVYVMKQEDDATFTVTVVDGEGLFIRAKADDSVDVIPLVRGDQVIVRPWEAYSYVNTNDEADLVLHDVALPAFKTGDDIELTSSLIPEERPTPRDGYSICVVEDAEGNRHTIELPDTFFDTISTVQLSKG